MYREMKTIFEISPYLLIVRSKKFRIAIAKLRITSHHLNIEIGRHRNIERLEQKCVLCDKNDLEDVKFLQHSGFADVWLYPESVDSKKFIPMSHCRLRDIYITDLKQSIHLSSSLVMYREMKTIFEISPYLLIVRSKKFRIAIAKLRLASHHLNIEIGRHRNIERLEQKCVLCDKNDLEDVKFLQHSGFADVWLYPESVDSKKFIPMSHCRLRDIYITDLKQSIHLSSSLVMYREMKTIFEISPYLLIVRSKKN